MIRALTMLCVLALVAAGSILTVRPAGAQVLGGSSVNATGRSNVPLSAPRYTSTAASGSNGFACAFDGCRVDLGTGTNDYLYSSGSAVVTPGAFTASGGLYASGSSGVYSGTGGFTVNGTGSATLKGTITDGATAIAAKIVNLNALSTAGSKIVSFYSDNGTTEKAYINKDGFLASATEHTLLSWWFNDAAATGTCPATGTGCVGHVLPAKAFTVTGLTSYVSVVGGGGAGNTVVTITDGTNTCTATLPCTSGTDATGPIRVATANGAGTGCVYAASASLTASVTTAGCTTTQPTLRNVDIVGKWQ